MLGECRWIAPQMPFCIYDKTLFLVDLVSFTQSVNFKFLEERGPVITNLSYAPYPTQMRSALSLADIQEIQYIIIRWIPRIHNEICLIDFLVIVCRPDVITLLPPLFEALGIVD